MIETELVLLVAFISEAAWYLSIITMTYWSWMIELLAVTRSETLKEQNKKQ
jgi:ABC-type microcin C transport system permease subunit YejE